MSDLRFSRTAQLLGQAAVERLQHCFVVVVGLGAVGSFAVEALARSGVGRLRLVDFDTVQTVNLNRQLYALESTLGRLKCDVAQERVRDIHPACQVESLPLRFNKDHAAAVLGGGPDLVLDAIDSVRSKAELILAAQRASIPLIAAMGAARRTDPARIKAGPFSQVTHCRLARQLRQILRQQGFTGDFPCIYSEEPMAPMGPGLNSAGLACSTPPDPRAGLGSLCTVTGSFGLRLAHEALRHLLGGALRPPAR